MTGARSFPHIFTQSSQLDFLAAIEKNAFERMLVAMGPKLKKTPPPGIQVASHRNQDRCAINAAFFEECTNECAPHDGSVLEDACIVFVDNLAAKDGSKCTSVCNNNVLRHFCENVSESDLGRPGKKSGRFDPCLKIHQDCPLMFTKNENVSSGQANGSRTLAKKVTS